MKVTSKKTLMLLMLTLTGGGLLQAAMPAEQGQAHEPVILRSVEPIIPPEFARYGIDGEVEVLFRIDERGRPTEIKVENATHYEYAVAVKNALRSWRFERRPEQAGARFRLPVLFN